MAGMMQARQCSWRRFSFFCLASLFLFLMLAAGNPLRARTVVDDLGRKMEVPERPQRIISLAPSLTETLFQLGLGPQVVGVTDYCEHPPEARQKTRLGGIINPSLERIVALKPDLAFATSEANKFEILTQLEKFKIPVFSTTPRNLEGAIESIRRVGEAAGVPAEAAQLAATLSARLAAVRATVATLGKPRVLILYDLKPAITGGRRTFPTDLITAAGGESIAAGLEQDWPRLNIEFIVARNPEIIFLSSMPGTEEAKKELPFLPGWKMTSAVRTGRIYTVDDRINQPGPSIIDALEWLARQIHPEAFRTP